MADTPSAQTADQASASGQPQAGQQTSSATTETPQAGASQLSSTSSADYERQIAELRKENAAHRTKLSAFERAQADADTAKLSEVEKAQKAQQAAEAAAQAYRDRIGAYEVRLAAQKLGIIDPDLAALAIQAKLEYADDGTPTNADKLLADLLKDKPFLAPGAQPATPGATGGASVTSGGAVNPGRALTSGAYELSWERISRMTAAEYDARRTEILAFMQRNPPKR